MCYQLLAFPYASLRPSMPYHVGTLKSEREQKEKFIGNQGIPVTYLLGSMLICKFILFLVF